MHLLSCSAVIGADTTHLLSCSVVIGADTMHLLSCSAVIGADTTHLLSCSAVIGAVSEKSLTSLVSIFSSRVARVPWMAVTSSFVTPEP